MSEAERRQLIPVAFRGVELGRHERESASDMSLVLKTTDEGPLQEYLVPVPAERDGEYTLIIRHFLSQVAAADTFLGEIENAVGSHISSLVVRPDEQGRDRARMTLTTDRMEVVPFDVAMHEGVLYAMVHSLPILVEESLLVPSLRRDEVDDDGLIRRRSPEAEYSALRYGLDRGRMPEDYEAERLSASLDVIGRERVQALLDRAVASERYEWAQWIQEYLRRTER